MIKTLKSKGALAAKASQLAISTAALGFVTLISATATQAEFGDGFREFKQDSCDPLLTGVLTNRGYVDADINALYADGYDLDAQRGCGFTKLPPVAVNPQPVDPFPVPVDPTPFQPVEPFDPNQFNPIPPVDNTPVIPTIPDVVIPDPVDLPEIEEPATRLANGLYARASAAYLWPKDATAASGKLSTNNSASDLEFMDSAGQSFGGSLALGYGFNFGGLGPLSNLRTELQGSYYSIDSEQMTNFTGIPFTLTTGEEVLYGGFLNLLADIDIGLPVQPYIGGGIGYGRRDFRWEGDLGGTQGVYKFEEDGLLYQAMLGAEFGLTKNATIGLGYKYLKSFDVENAVDAGDTVDAGDRTWSIEGRDHHMVEGGLTYKF